VPEEQPSKVPPTLVAALIADTGAVDPVTQKKTLVGIFNRIFARSVPTQRPMMLYFCITDGIGLYPIKIQLLLLAKEELLVAEIEGAIRLGDRTQSVDFLIPTPPLPFPAPGRYEFRLLASDMHVGGICLDVVQQTPRPPQEKTP
jgi:hypothetical protein